MDGGENEAFILGAFRSAGFARGCSLELTDYE
jgi:hypothetical protein